MNDEHAKTKRNNRIGILRPITGILAVIGLIAIVVTAIRAIAGRGRADTGQSAAAPIPAAPVPPVPVPPTPPPTPARTPHRRGFKRLARHPFVIAMLVVALVLLGTAALAFMPLSGGTMTIGGIVHQPSDYDKFFTYSQMEAMADFAKCDAMLFSTQPAEELLNVMERMSIEVEFGGSTGAAVGEYIRRVRSPVEIAETIRLASEFYERANCL